MNQLSPEALQMLKLLCAEYAAEPFEEGREERLRPVTLCRAEQRLAIHELRRAGLLIARQKIWGEKLYQIPVEQLPHLEYKFFAYQPRFKESCNMNLTMEAGAGLEVDLFRALLFIAREGLPLTAKGSIHKKSLNRLAAQLSFREEYFHGVSVLSHYQEIEAPSVVVAVDLMLSLGLISRQNDGYIPKFDILKGWLQLSESRMKEILYTVVINRYGSSRPADQHFRHLISAPEFSPGKWSELSELVDWMVNSNLVKGNERTELEKTSLEWLRCLVGFGWCELGHSQDGKLCFRWTSAKPKLTYASEQIVETNNEHSSTSFIVQPDFEVLVPPEVPYSVRWTLAGCSELLQSDAMWSFRLSREMLEFAADKGMSPQESISWLSAHALGGIPSVVKLSLEQWGRSIGRTSLSEVILLTCQSEEEGSIVASHPRLQDSIVRLGPLHFSVQPDHIEQVRKELLITGMAPSRIIGGREEGAEAGWLVFHHNAVAELVEYSLPSLIPEMGVYRPTAPYLNLPILPLGPDEEVVFNDENVPPIWCREWRHYHSSTAQKVMEQGLKWGIKVRFSLKNQMLDFIPSRITGNPWRVAGHLLYSDAEGAQEIELSAGDWKEMQLLIPK